MSMRNKLLAAAKAAAEEAMLVERARCLWCADEVIRELEGRLRKKLMSEAQIHTAQTKFKIAQAVVRELRRAIVSGVRPGGPEAGAADLHRDPDEDRDSHLIDPQHDNG